jgi:hypothetical protein
MMQEPPGTTYRCPYCGGVFTDPNKAPPLKHNCPDYDSNLRSVQ